MKNPLLSFLSAVAFLLPAAWRLLESGATQPLGLISDLAVGLLAWLLFLLLPRSARVVLVVLWAFFQVAAIELHAAMQRFPTWQDVPYLFDPDLVRNTTAGFNLLSPVKVGAMLVATLLCILLTAPRPERRHLRYGLLAGVALLAVHILLIPQVADTGVAARYNPLHWFAGDALAAVLRPAPPHLTEADLPEGLRRADLGGTPLLDKRRARNVLIVVLEGIPGLYYPEIRQAMGVDAESLVMQGLVANTERAMLIPDFVAHSHQTIRGLYALLCGDFSKLSQKTPKAFELTPGSQWAENCLPAQLARNGWSTHYLQGAGLTFMGKDRVMPIVGFQNAHGSEWFTDPDPYPFEWGASDPAFFAGARRYIAGLQAAGNPWMLTLLTVGTHQPYADASADVAALYPSRRDAAVAMLDQAVAGFLKGIADDGVPRDTLIILTSDESHGAEIADWVSSWGIGIVMVPEQDRLPRLKPGTFGLVDISASVLDYLGLAVPPTVIGRSLFRDYSEPREMVSSTSGKLRWHTRDNRRYECSSDSSRCRVGTADSLIGFPPVPLELDAEESVPLFYARAALLDDRLLADDKPRLMRFADGEIRRLPERVVNEWSDNLVGAQYLDFPERSKTHVSVRIKAVEAGDEGIQLKLNLRQYEYLVTDIDYPPFPLLRSGDVATIAFDFTNPKARQAFSFHLFGEGKDAAVKIEEFNVTVDRRGI